MVIPLLIDRLISFDQCGSSSSWLLDLPVGPCSLLDHLSNQMADLDHRGLLIMPATGNDDRCDQSRRTNTLTALRSIQPQELRTVIHDYEPSDQLLVIDPIRQPISDFDVGAMISRYADYRGVTHAIAVGTDRERTRERVESDGNGRVRCVQRLYDRVSWPEVAATNIFLSIVPVQAVDGICFTSLTELRAALSASGVLGRDAPIHLDLVDVTTEEGLLVLNERLLTQSTCKDVCADFSERNTDVFVGGGCQIHPSARLIGPVILHAKVKIDKGVTIIGPSVVGAGACIEKDAIITQAVLTAETHVAAGITVQHRVVSGHCSSSLVGTAPRTGQMPITFSLSGGGKPSSDSTEAPINSLRNRKVHLAIKRVVDMVLSFIGLVILSPLLLVVAILIKLESRGPVLFMHRREQKDGAEFTCFKFRTMDMDAHRQQRELYKQNELDGPQFKIQSDPRVTRIGHWLRVTNIDELPQLINVLLGHMSLVGPRPSPFRENQICVPWRRARLSVRPGITGLWQVCRSENRTGGDFHEWIYYDIGYVRYFSIWLDIKILLATVATCGGRWRAPLSWLIKTGRGDHRRVGGLLAAPLSPQT